MKKIVLEKGMSVFEGMSPFVLNKKEKGNVFGGLECSVYTLCTSSDRAKRSTCKVYTGQCANQLGCGVYRFESGGPVIQTP